MALDYEDDGSITEKFLVCSYLRNCTDRYPLTSETPFVSWCVKIGVINSRSGTVGWREMLGDLRRMVGSNKFDGMFDEYMSMEESAIALTRKAAIESHKYTYLRLPQFKEFERGQSSGYDNSFSKAEALAASCGSYTLAWRNENKVYEGKILGSTLHHVVQSLGKTAVIHHKGNLINLPKGNEIMSITYACGLRASVDPVVKEHVKSIGMGR